MVGLLKIINDLNSGEKELIKLITDGNLKHLAIRATEFKLQDIEYKLISLQDIKSELEEQEVSLEVVRPGGPAREPVELPMTGDNMTTVRVDAAAELPRVSVRVSQETARVTADSVTVLETEQSPWRMTTRFLFHVKPRNTFPF